MFVCTELTHVYCITQLVLNTALSNIWTKQSVCTTTKMSEKNVSLIYNFKGTLFSEYCLCYANYSYRIFGNFRKKIIKINPKILTFQPSILPDSLGIGFRGRCIQGVTS